MKMAKMNILLLLFVILLVVVPLLLIRDSEFGGSDGQAVAAIQEISPSYEPWFQPLIEPPGGETESLLFAIQAAAGAGMIGYVVGYYKGRSRKQQSPDRQQE